MPLEQGKSPKAFENNLKAEMHAGKPQKQALAIAYSVKKRNKQMAGGGKVHCAHGGPAHCNMGCYDEGGEVNEKLHPEMDHKQIDSSQKARMHGIEYHNKTQNPMNESNEVSMSKGGAINSADAAEKAINYEEGIDEPEDEMSNMPHHLQPEHLNSKDAIDAGRKHVLATDEPMESADVKRNDSMPELSDSSDSREMSHDFAADTEDPMSDPIEYKMAGGGMLHPKKMAKMIMMAAGGMIDSAKSWDKAEALTKALESQPEMGSDREDIDVAWTTPHDDNLSSEGDYPLMEEEGYEEGRQAKMRRKGGLMDRVMARVHSR